MEYLLALVLATTPRHGTLNEPIPTPVVTESESEDKSEKVEDKHCYTDEILDAEGQPFTRKICEWEAE